MYKARICIIATCKKSYNWITTDHIYHIYLMGQRQHSLYRPSSYIYYISLHKRQVMIWPIYYTIKSKLRKKNALKMGVDIVLVFCSFDHIKRMKKNLHWKIIWNNDVLVYHFDTPKRGTIFHLHMLTNIIGQLFRNQNVQTLMISLGIP